MKMIYKVFFLLIIFFFVIILCIRTGNLLENRKALIESFFSLSQDKISMIGLVVNGKETLIIKDAPDFQKIINITWRIQSSICNQEAPYDRGDAKYAYTIIYYFTKHRFLKVRFGYADEKSIISLNLSNEKKVMSTTYYFAENLVNEFTLLKRMDKE